MHYRTTTGKRCRLRVGKHPLPLSSRQLRFERLEQRRLLAASTIELFAAGQTNEETMELQIDGVTVATFANVGGDAVNRVFQSYSYTHPTAVTLDQLRVAFTNNLGSAPGVDRNLRVDRLVLDGVSHETEAPTTFSTGTWDPVTDCSPGAKQSEWLHCDGYFAYSEPGGQATVEILAAGETNEETMELQIDGVTVATFANIGGDAVNRVFQSYSYVHPTPLTLDQIRVAFTNNGVSTGGGDINLRVDKIVLNGVSYETEAPTTFSTGTWDPVNGCSPGAKVSEWMHCDGYFEYGLPANGSTFEIHAAGETNEETMELQIDGLAVATFTNVGGDAVNRVFEVYTYTHTSPVTIDQVRVAFTNNGVSTLGEDINLRVDKLILDGTTFQSEASDTFSTGS
ncbi:MAG: hypothetical protein MI725_09630, partial [Pirellulales bacterium]|nr:hypothetical protein [Pirellulales bacterium]